MKIFNHATEGKITTTNDGKIIAIAEYSADAFQDGYPNEFIQLQELVYSNCANIFNSNQE